MLPLLYWICGVIHFLVTGVSLVMFSLEMFDTLKVNRLVKTIVGLSAILALVMNVHFYMNVAVRYVNEDEETSVRFDYAKENCEYNQKVQKFICPQFICSLDGTCEE